MPVFLLSMNSIRECGFIPAMLSIMQPNYKQDFLANSKVYRLPFPTHCMEASNLTIRTKAVFIPGYLFMYQAKANEVNFGLTAGIHVIRDPAKRATFYLGLWKTG